MKYYFNSAVALLGTATTVAFGGWDLPLKALICLMAADYISGVALAISNKQLSSSIGFKGLAKKGCILLIIMLSVMLDRLINNGHWTFRTLTAYFYIANEGISIVENAAALGIPIPKKIREILSQLSSENDE